MSLFWYICFVLTDLGLSGRLLEQKAGAFNRVQCLLWNDYEWSHHSHVNRRTAHVVWRQTAGVTWFCSCSKSIQSRLNGWSFVARLDSNYRLILAGITARWSHDATHVKIIWHIDSVNPPQDGDTARVVWPSAAAADRPSRHICIQHKSEDNTSRLN